MRFHTLLILAAALLVTLAACGKPSPVANATHEASLIPSNPWGDAIAKAEKEVAAAEVAVKAKEEKVVTIVAPPKETPPVVVEPKVTPPVVVITAPVTPPVVPVVTPEVAPVVPKAEDIVARVSPKGFKVSEGVSYAVAASLEKTVEAGTGDIVQCYREAVQQGVTPEGKLTIKIDVDDAGKTTDVAMVTDEVGEPVSTCVAEKAGAWVYEAPGQPVSIYRRWVFGE